MKTATRPRSIGRKPPARSGRLSASPEVYTLSQAKVKLGELVQKAGTGKAVFIVLGRRYFSLQCVPEITPIPLRPLGFFQFGPADIALDNHLASANVVPDPTVE